MDRLVIENYISGWTLHLHWSPIWCWDWRVSLGLIMFALRALEFDFHETISVYIRPFHLTRRDIRRFDWSIKKVLLHSVRLISSQMKTFAVSPIYPRLVDIFFLTLPFIFKAWAFPLDSPGWHSIILITGIVFEWASAIALDGSLELSRLCKNQ